MTTLHSLSDASGSGPAGGDAAGAVCIQGERHSFHHRAVQALLPGREVAPVRSFPLLAQKVAATEGRLGLMAIENSVAGALLTNYLLLEEHELRIHAEVYLRISHALLTVPGAGLDEVRTVESHPMALAQCREFFARRPRLRPVEAYDTAGSAEAVAAGGQVSRAAIAPLWCAEPYGLAVAAEAIEDSPHNWTRFFLIGATDAESFGTKTSVAFSVGHHVGSLVRPLQVLAEAGSSLTKIQSLPIVGKPWAYRFFADFLHPAGPPPTDLLAGLAGASNDLHHLGTYPEGKHHEP